MVEEERKMPMAFGGSEKKPSISEQLPKGIIGVTGNRITMQDSAFNMLS